MPVLWKALCTMYAIIKLIGESLHTLMTYTRHPVQHRHLNQTEPWEHSRQIHAHPRLPLYLQILDLMVHHWCHSHIPQHYYKLACSNHRHENPATCTIKCTTPQDRLTPCQSAWINRYERNTFWKSCADDLPTAAKKIIRYDWLRRKMNNSPICSSFVKPRTSIASSTWRYSSTSSSAVSIGT